jgi:hypothetical protein
MYLSAELLNAPHLWKGSGTAALIASVDDQRSICDGKQMKIASERPVLKLMSQWRVFLLTHCVTIAFCITHFAICVRRGA